jgi:hypothetical protein
METWEIILVVILAIWLIHYIIWGFRAARVVTQHKRAIESVHPTGPPDDWPPGKLDFP